MPVNETSLSEIHENRNLGRWWKILGRHPHQLNGAHEADSELIRVPGTDIVLAATIDSIAEEVKLGIYRNGETIGWVAVMASLSDLAATGAEPLGLLVSATIPQNDPALQDAIARGLDAACRSAGTFVLGGDTNFSNEISIGVCALGTIPQSARPMLRTGMRPGDILFATGKFGRGAALLAGMPESEYRPSARTAAARWIREYASACMDTSDGLIATLDQLARLNGCRVECSLKGADLLEPEALNAHMSRGLPPFVFLASPHGEFELVFSVPQKDLEAFMARAQQENSNVLEIARVTPGSGIHFDEMEIDTARVRNLIDEVSGDLERYVAELIKLGPRRSPE